MMKRARASMSFSSCVDQTVQFEQLYIPKDETSLSYLRQSTLSLKRNKFLCKNLTTYLGQNKPGGYWPWPWDQGFDWDLEIPDPIEFFCIFQIYWG